MHITSEQWQARRKRWEEWKEAQKSKEKERQK
jgi:hypothetical protein